ncbi:ABC1 kinase family protein [Mycetocola zhujimingii]|uniref:ABC1 kinase family protein n=1 Tax=Mycetocola zhujimingii TaxID=2079792 RepID=UPI000D3AD5C7|nr:AarF/ABC1/UbiB kinase family protein [Mycetocola zhujimingii]AWB87715.1 ABC transporter [Mycetocola zhujimingii]
MTASNRLDRYAEIARVLSRNGFGALAGGLGLGRWISPADSARAEKRNPSAERLRMALEELGPTFIKVGQLLSTRADLLPPDYIAELSKLQSSAPPVASAVVMTVIESELGAPTSELFAEFTEEPLASASIGQAHAAVLKDGTRVVVKVRRPGAVAQVNEDLEILSNLASQATARWDLAADYDLVGLIDQFSVTIRAELDYLTEARNAERFAENFRDSRIHIPRVFRETTTSRVLTLERITGVRVDDLPALDEAGVDRSEVIALAVDAICQMVFVDGFFHADPHPGNLFIETDGRIGLIDFGMVGSIDEKMRDHLVSLFSALLQGDPDHIASAVLTVASSSAHVNRPQLRRDFAHFMTLYSGKELAELEIGAMVAELLGVLRRHRLQLDPQLVLLLRMLSMIEGMGVRLDPTFRLSIALEPYATRFAAERFSPRALVHRASEIGRQLAALGVELPQKLRMLSDSIGPDGIEIQVRAEGLDPIMGRVEKIGNRLVVAMIASALIRGIGEFTVSGDSRWRAWSEPLMRLGIGSLGALSAYLAVSARHRRNQR